MNRSRLSFPCGAATAISLLAASFALLAQGERAPQTDSSQAALLENVHVVKLPKRKSGYRNIGGSMIQLKDGRLLLGYTSYSPSGEYSGAIAARISEDHGRSWGSEFTLVSSPRPEANHGYQACSFVRLDNGEILLSYYYYVHDTRPVFKVTLYRRSRDEGASWGDPLYLGLDAVFNDKLLLLKSGRLIAPVEQEQSVQGGDHRGYVSYVHYSDDSGYSWRRSRNGVNMLPVEAQEPQVVELKDGRLMMLFRTYSGYVGRAYSRDGGESWGRGQAIPELSLPPNSSALNVKRIPGTGDLLLLRCSAGSGGLRTPFVSSISRDEGRSWTQQRVIAGDPEDDYGYPSLLFLEEKALVTYHTRRGLRVARIGLNWFYGR